MKTLVAFALTIAVASGIARADEVVPPDAPASTPCDALAARAQELYAAERLREALEASERAYACDPRPPLLFAMGQIAFNLGDYAAAERWYTKFLATTPSPEDEALALQALAVTRERAEAAKKPAKVVVVEPRADRLAWGLAIGAGVTSIGGGALYLIARQRSTDTTGAYADYDARVERAKDLRTAAIVFGGVGAALAIAATIRWAVHSPASSVTPAAEPASVQIVPIVGDGGIGITFAGAL